MFDCVTAIECDGSRRATTRCLATGEVGIDIHTDPNWLILKWVFISQSKMTGQVLSQSFKFLIGAFVRHCKFAASFFGAVGNVWSILCKIIATSS